MKLCLPIFSIFLSRSSEEDFNPKPATPSHLCHSLIELLNQISPAFKRNFSILQKKRTQRHPFERVATPYQLYSWSAPQMEHTIDAIRAEDSKFCNSFQIYHLETDALD
jgi:protein TIF31